MAAFDPVLLDERSVDLLQRELDSSRQNPRRLVGAHSDPSLSIASHRAIKFKNNSSETAPAFAVMRITGATALKNLTIDKPNTSFQRIYLVNGPMNVPAGKYGWGSYLTAEHFDIRRNYCLYDTGNTPAYGESWGPQDGTWTLAKYRYGFTIIGGNAGSGSTARTLIVQQPVNVIYGQTDGAINKGSSGTVEVYDGNNSIITSTTITATNRFANVADNKKVMATWIGGTWLLSAAEC